MAATTAPAPVPAQDELDNIVDLPIRPPLAALMPLVGFLVLLGLAVAFDPSRTHVTWQVSFGVFAAAELVFALVAQVGVALLLAACAWFDYDGFVVGHQGALQWHGATDVVRIVVLVCCVLAAFALRRAERGTPGGATGP